jgi:serine beta-lactamase-like protein LACTB, mitochondrial
MHRALKIVLWTLGAGIVVPAVIVGLLLAWMSSREEKAPDNNVPFTSVVYDTAFAEVAAQALQVLQQSQQARGFPSVAMAVGVDGKLVWAGTAGYEEVATGKPATVDSRYYIASIAKFFTSIALGKLVEQGTVDFDASYRALVPDFPALEHDFTLRQLQTHQAGIRHWRVVDVFNNHDYKNVREAAADLEDSPLLFEPGAATSYSTPGYTLLALGMERATGKDYQDLMQQLVFEPAGMQSIMGDSAGRPKDQAVVPYLVHEKIMMRVPAFNVSDRLAGGGFLATPSDVVRFGNAVLEGNMISAAYRATLLQRDPAEPEVATSGKYPRSFTAEQSALGLKLTGGGSSWGGRAALSLYPEKRIVVVTATNTRPSDNQGAGINEDEIAALFDTVIR